MKKIIILIVTIALLGSAAMLLKKRKQSVANTPVPTPPTYQVKVVSATTENLEQTRPFLAQLLARDTALIASKLSGRIKKILVQEDQTVKEGALLVQIDDLELLSSIKSLKASLKAQEQDVLYTKKLNERNRALFEAGGLAREKFEASEVASAIKQAALEATRQKIKGLQVQLSYLNIKAPFDGRVGTLFAHIGDLAVPGKPLISLNSLTQKLTFSYVPNTVSVQNGQEAFIKRYKIGHISNLYSDARNGLSVAEIALDAPLDVPNNSYVNINLLTFSGSGCRIPLDALLQRAEGVQVMGYADGVFVASSVSVIAANKDYALVKPCPESPVAVASDAKLSLLPGLGRVLVHGSRSHE